MTDTAPIRAEERFDTGRVADHLRQHLGDLFPADPISFEQFPGGRANLTYLARSGDVEVVLRRPPLGPVAPGSHDMSREHKVLSVLNSVYPEAPQAYHYCSDPDVMGKPFFVMERRKGNVVRAAWPAPLAASPPLQRTVAEGLVGALGRLHGVAFESIGLGDLGRPEGFVERQVSGWSARWDRARSEDVPAMERLASVLAGSIPKPQRASLIHNDFKLDNCMISNDGSLVAVFDWDMATVGDPLVDLGTFLGYWSGPVGVGESIWSGLSVPLGGVMSPGEVVEEYATATGLDADGVEWYQALGLFRLAVILQQIYIRYVRGQTTDERFEVLGSLVRPIAETALDHVA